MSDDFKDAPKSVSEIRSDRSGNGKDWTPRDVLISLLRDIDNGKPIDVIFVAFAVDDVVGFRAASPHPLKTSGTITIAQHQWLEGSLE